MIKILKGMSVNNQGLERNLASAGSSVLAEPAYILLSSQGESDAHEIIRKLTLDADRQGISLHQAMKADPEVWGVIADRLAAVGIGDADGFFSNPERYRGRTVERARELSQIWDAKVREMTNSLAAEGRRNGKA
jgi:adenylosuccinate lyase